MDGVLAPGFLFPAISVCCLPACPPSLGNFQGWGSKSVAAPGRAPGAPSLEISRGRRAGGGLGGKGVPRSAHKKQISCCCPGSPAHISSLTGSAARLRVTSRCFHSPHSSREGAYRTGMGIIASSGVADRPLPWWEGGSLGPPAPPRIPAWPHPAPPYPGAVKSLLPAPSP